MEIILIGILVAVGIWFFVLRKSEKPKAADTSPTENVEAPYKVEAPVATPEVVKPVEEKAEVSAPVVEPAVVEAKPAKKTRAKKAPAAKAAPAKTAKKTVKSKADIRRVK